MGSENVTYTGHCPNCGEQRSIYRTVAWQTDTCTVCGSEIETEPAASTGD